jgi:hypothetical protein
MALRQENAKCACTQCPASKEQEVVISRHIKTDPIIISLKLNNIKL